MKTTVNIYVILSLAVLLGSCSATNNLTMGAIEPARVYLSPDVKKVAIIDRSSASEKHEKADKIDQILSVEGMQLDKKGSQASIKALKNELSADGRFDEVVIIDTLELERKGLGVFPASLDWDFVEELCRVHDVDAIFALEFYDTDTRASYEITTREFPNNLGIKVPLPYHRVTLNTLIKNGWRIYLPSERAVLDEFTYQLPVFSVGEGINPIKAVEAVNGREEAVLEQSRNIGNQYAWRIRPTQKRISREYFVKGTENFEIAKRRAQTGDWEGAAQLWEIEVDNPKGKVAGRACYNMAIIHEIEGNLDQAIEWASRSYTDYKNKDALRYMRVLNSRVAEQAELDRQLAR